MNDTFILAMSITHVDMTRQKNKQMQNKTAVKELQGIILTHSLNSTPFPSPAALYPPGFSWVQESPELDEYHSTGSPPKRKVLKQLYFVRANFLSQIYKQ